jgi:hypothetical protein
MKTHRMKLSFISILTVIIFTSLFFLGWGRDGHRIINKAGARDFPDLTIVTPSIIQRLTDSASVPDSRSSESWEPNHFMDMERLAEFPTHSITHNLDSLFQEYGENYIRNTVGFLPWVIDSTMNALTNQMRGKDWNRAWSSASDLGHYLADAYQPLHTTRYYGGSESSILPGYTGSGGIHSRYESNMIKRFQSNIIIDSSAVHLIPHPLDTAFAIMYQSNSYRDSIYIADQVARSYDPAYSTIYYDTLWTRVNPFTTLQFCRAAVEYGSFLYTAWINAGSPSTLVEQWDDQIRDFRLDQNYPNPFNPSTTVSFSVRKYGYTCIKVYNTLGREVVTLVDGVKPPGRYSILWNADKFPSGIYFYRLNAEGSSVARKMILLK